MNKKEQINEMAKLIYDDLDYMYCDNCRFNSEIKKEDCNDESGICWGCEDCYRKYNGWGISKNSAIKLAKKILALE